MRSLTPLSIAALLCLGLFLALGEPLSAETGADTPIASESDNALLWRITFTNRAHLNSLAGSLDIWEVDHSSRSVLAMLTAVQAQALSDRGEQIVRAGRRPQGPGIAPAASVALSGYIPGFPCYRTVEKTERDLQSLAAKHPNLAVWSDIGDSWDKVRPAPPAGRDIYALTLTNRDSCVPKFKFLLVAAMHARELVTAEIATRFGEYLIERYGVDPDVTWLLDYGEVHIVPVANPDGRKFAEQLYYWRKNTDSADGCASGSSYGVDLNRNSSFRWNACESDWCSSSDPCAATFRGQAPASEPETHALQAYAKSLFADQRPPGVRASAPPTTTGLLLSLHSYGEWVLFPWGWSSAPSPNDAGLRALASRLANPLGYTACQAGEPGCLYQVDGDLEDWAYGKLGIGAYTLEFGTEFFQQCTYFENEILYPALKSLMLGFKYSRMPYALSSVPQLNQMKLSQKRIVPGTPLTLTVTLPVTRTHTGESVGFQYSLDSPAWAADPSQIEQVFAAAEDGQSTITLSHTIDTLSWQVGRHLLFVEGIDSAGNVGIPTATYVDVMGPHTYFLPLINGCRPARPH